MPTPRLTLVSALAAALAVAPALLAKDLPAPRLDGFYPRWALVVDHLMDDDERAVFAALDHDLHRELFIRRFWQARGAGDPAAPPAALVRWRDNLDEARRWFERLDGDRARALIVAGKPARVESLGCPGILRRLELWTYEPWHVAYQTGRDEPAERGLELIFVRDSELDNRTYHQWSPADGAAALALGGPGRHDLASGELIDLARAGNCLRGSEPERLAGALTTALDAEALRRRFPPPAAEAGWLSRFAAERAAERPRRSLLPATPFEIDYPGRYNQRTILHGRVGIPTGTFARNAEGLLFDRATILGDVKRDGRLVDSFRVVHYLAGAEPADGRVHLDFYRRLFPGRYTLSLRVEDAYGLGLWRELREIEVPKREAPAAPPPGHRLGFVSLTRDEVGLLTTFPSVELLSPGDDHQVGPVEIEAVTTGGPIERVAFRLDGADAGSDDTPPFAVTLDLGSSPARREVEAIAYDPAGRALARDRRLLNATPPRFAVRLVAPVTGGHGRRAVVEVDVPAGEALDRVELWVNKRRVATLRQPPFAVDLPPYPPVRTVYLRAVATLHSGAALEDLVIVRTADPIEAIDVELVELYTSVLDRRGRLVTGLAADAFQVLEDGEPQRVLRFDTVANLAINVALVMDASSSMRRRVEVAVKSALRFFETVLTPKDRASVFTFNHAIDHRVPFTADPARLRYAASGLRAYGTTRMHDSLVYALHAFGGLEGKRALVLLSDGQDVDSDFDARQVLLHALQAGVAVYPILLDVVDEATQADLERLGTETGGRVFTIRAAGELDAVYRQIEEDLRSQYLLVYRPPPGRLRHEFRRVTVEVAGDGLRARTLRGYYR